MNNQGKYQNTLLNAILVVVGIICLGIGIWMIYQNTQFTIAGKPYSSGLALLLAGLVIIMVALANLATRTGTRNMLMVIFFFGGGLLVGYVLWALGNTFTVPPIIEHKLFKDLLVLILAIAGIVITIMGYGAYRILERHIEDYAREVMNEVYLRAQASAITHLGFIFWRIYKSDQRKMFNLNHAIELTKHAYRYTQDLSEKKTENKRLMCTVRSDLAHYLAEYCRRGQGSEVDRIVALDYAEYVFRRKTLFTGSDLEEIIDTYHFVQQHCGAQ